MTYKNLSLIIDTPDVGWSILTLWVYPPVEPSVANAASVRHGGGPWAAVAHGLRL